MSIPAFRRLKQPNRIAQDLQSNTGGVLNALSQAPLADAVVASWSASQTTPAGTNITIAHGLGHSPKGIIPLLAVASNLIPGNASWIISSTLASDPSVFVVLQCSATLQRGAAFSWLVW